MDIMSMVSAFTLAHPFISDLLVILGGLHMILGIVSKWTPWKWDDNLYSILHDIMVNVLSKIPGLSGLNGGKK